MKKQIKAKAYFCVLVLSLMAHGFWLVAVCEAQELKDVPHVVKKATIVEVKDGDTLVAKGGMVIRLLGVNTPEVAIAPHRGAAPLASAFGRLSPRKRGEASSPHPIGFKLTSAEGWDLNPAWPYAQTATEFVKRWVVGKKVVLKISKKYPKDKYGRTLAVLVVPQEKTSLNLKLISVGLGKVLVEDNDLVNEKYWRMIQEKAVKMKRGIWSVKP